MPEVLLVEHIPLRSQDTEMVYPGMRRLAIAVLKAAIKKGDRAWFLGERALPDQGHSTLEFWLSVLNLVPDDVHRLASEHWSNMVELVRCFGVPGEED